MFTIIIVVAIMITVIITTITTVIINLKNLSLEDEFQPVSRKTDVTE
jgi:hypothetical protein